MAQHLIVTTSRLGFQLIRMPVWAIALFWYVVREIWFAESIMLVDIWFGCPRVSKVSMVVTFRWLVLLLGIGVRGIKH